MEKKLLSEIKKNVGENPLVFLDTGAVIDFEKDLKVWRRKYGAEMNHLLYGKLTENFPIFVTEHTLREIVKHNKDHIINGSKEISDLTLERMQGYHEDYCSFVKQADFMESVGQIGLDVFWANKLAFKDNKKKRERDPMSYEDRKLLENALFLRYAIDSNGKPITSSTILSPDRHISGTIKVLKDLDGYLLSQMQKDGIKRFGHTELYSVSSR